MQEELTIGSTVYHCTVFKEINSHRYFQVSKDCQHNLLYWLLHMEPFSLLESQCISTPRTVISNQVYSGKVTFSPFVNIFWQKHVSLYTWPIFQQISLGLLFSANKNLMTDLCSSTAHSVWFTAILNSIKRNNLVRLK